MKKKLLLLIILFNSALYAQQQDAWVYFTGKPEAAYYLANPLEMLSQKALTRRAAHNIALDEKDVPIHQAYVDGITNAPGITVMAKSKWLNAVHVRGGQATISALQNLTYVDYIEFANHSLNNGRMMQTAQTVQTTTTQNTLENFNYGQSAGQVQMLNGHLLHQQGFTGGGMTIAVIDAGFPGVNTTQPFQHLLNNDLVLGGYNFVNNSTNIYTGDSHGTLVLSTLAGYVEGQLIGSAPDAFYYLFVTEDNNSENPVEESYWVEAAEMADSLGVDIISTSLGYLDYDNASYTYSYADLDGQTAFMSRGADIAFTRGMLLVTAAGNDGNHEEPHINVPADAINTLAVGAVDANEQYASFSSIGPSADGRVKPDVMAQGFLATYAGVDGSISMGNGTSFAAPIMAGAVACLWQAAPSKTNAEIMQIVKQSADRYNNPNDQYGYGIPDFSTALAAALALAEAEHNPFVLYPNPTSGVVTVYATNGMEGALVTLYNNVGQKVLEQQISSTASFSTDALQAGMYLYTITLRDTTQQGKLIKR